MKRVLDAEEVDALLGTFSRAPTSIRNRALVTTLWRSGLRIGEALDLRPGDLDRDGGRIEVRNGKGGKARTVAMGPLAWDELDRWLVVRRKRGIGSDAPVFCTLGGRPLAQPYIRGLLKRKARQAGFQDASRVHPHAFRHAFAVEMVRAGKPIEHLRRLLGHSSLAVTTAYLSRIDPEETLESARGLGGEPLSEVEQLRQEVASLAARLNAA